MERHLVERHLVERQFKLTLCGCVVSVYCIGFASLDVVYDELTECALNLGR